MTTTPDAVEALARSMLKVYETAVEFRSAAAHVITDLELKGFTIARAEPAPVGFDAAIKQLGEPDVATGHWSLDEGNLRWFVGQCKAEPAMTEAELLLHCQSLAMEFADDNLRKECEQAAFELAKKYRG